MPPRTVIHVADMEIHRHTGMGRISYHWREAFRERGWQFLEIGSKQVGPVPHRALWHRYAWGTFQSLGVTPSAILVHEPASGIFTGRGFPVALFSHGIEERGRRVMDPILQARHAEKPPALPARLKSLLTRPLWAQRAAQCARGLRRADLLLLSNTEDRSFAMAEYGRPAAAITVFKNGVYPLSPAAVTASGGPTLLFLGTWNDRKGSFTLIEAAAMLHHEGRRPRYLLAGTQVPAAEILSQWPEALRASVEVIPSFAPEREAEIMARATLFILPSLIEGQPLVLLQAMAQGLCCVTTDCCGQRDLVRQRENGLLYPPADAAALARQLAWALDHPEEAKRLGEQASTDVATRTWSAVGHEMVDHLEALLAAPR